MKTKRIWRPNRKYVGNTTIPISVDHWEWTKRKGLWVYYKGGEDCKSDYKTLPEFLKAIKEGREFASEEVVQIGEHQKKHS